MIIHNIHDFQRFTTFDLDRLSDTALHQPFSDSEFESADMTLVFHVVKYPDTEQSYNDLNLQNAHHILFEIGKYDGLYAVIHFGQARKLVKMEQLPIGSYNLFFNIKDRIFNDYIDHHHLDEKVAYSFCSCVMFNLLENRFMLNLLAIGTEKMLYEQIDYYYSQWVTSAESKPSVFIP